MRSNLKSTAKTLKSLDKPQLFEDGVRKKAWKGRLKICLVYPHTYFVGMSNLGLHQIYGLWNDLDEVVCERAFLPESGEEILSIESGRPLKDFDVIAFTLSFENDAIHVLRILANSGLALRSEDRSESDPLILMGGAAVSMNPCPLIPFVDAFAFGDGEDLVFDIARTLRSNPFLRHDRSKQLESLLDISGIYIPSIHGVSPSKAIQRRSVRFINSFLTKTEIVTNFTEFSNSFMVEVSRGCPQRCRFCSVSYTEASTRFRRLSFLRSAFDEGIERVGRIGLVGAALADHPELLDMAEYVVKRKGEISLSSLRVEAVSDKIVDLLVYSNQRTLTLALETGSVRLQTVIKKRTEEAKVLHCVETALRAGIRNLKFYFIIGLPTEQREDILELANLLKRVHKVFFDLSRSLGNMGTMHISLNPFIPKPTTPFEACAHLSQEELEVRFQLLMRELHGLKNLHLSHEGWDTAILQSLLSVGGVEVSEFLLETFRQKDQWRKAIPKFSRLVDETIYRPKGLGESLSWGFISK